MPYKARKAARDDSTASLASARNIMVLSMQNSGLPIPAKPEERLRLTTITLPARSTFQDRHAVSIG